MPIDPPYGIIRNALRQGKVIPFLGAGASFGDRDPGTVPWRCQQVGASNSWKIEYLPTARELAELLASEGNFPEAQRELSMVAQYYDLAGGRSPLRSTLQSVFQFKQAPGKVHWSEATKQSRSECTLPTEIASLRSHYKLLRLLCEPCRTQRKERITMTVAVPSKLPLWRTIGTPYGEERERLQYRLGEIHQERERCWRR